MKAQEARVKRARKAYQAAGTPTAWDFKNLIRMDLVKDNKITTEDINLAEKVYGPDIGSLKGKSARSKPVPVVDNAIEIPDELININKELKLSTDRLSVNSLDFAITNICDLFHRLAALINSTY